MSQCIRRGCDKPRTIGHFCTEHQPHQQVSDDMVVQASIPSAAALLKAAVKKGLITPTTAYIAVA